MTFLYKFAAALKHYLFGYINPKVYQYSTVCTAKLIKYREHFEAIIVHN